MAFWLNSIIEVTAAANAATATNVQPKRYRFRGVHDVKIIKNIHSFTNTCIIQIPQSLRLKQAGIPKTNISNSEDVFTVGSKIVVQLGYNTKYNTEFTGFIRRVGFGAPCVIECEGYIYQLRHQLQPKEFINVDYTAVINYLIKDTDIVLSPFMQGIKIPITKFSIKNDTGAEALTRFQHEMHDTLSIVFHNNILYVGLTYLQFENAVKYRLNFNTIKSDELKLHNSGDTTLKVMVYAKTSDVNKVFGSAGDNTNVIKKYKTGLITDKNILDVMATNLVAAKKFTGYEGKIIALGKPFCEHAWSAEITDKKYPERAGTYYISGVEITFNTGGFRRMVELEKRIK